MTALEFAFPTILSEMVERIARQFDPLRIILFGSWARGDARADSDFDLLVVLSRVDNKRSATIQIGDSLSDLPVSKDIVVTTPDEIERRGKIIGDVLRPALREGIIIYERT
jgi:uncharacterized protein